MAYWKDTFGENKSRDFIEGVKAGVEAFAIWEDGMQYVGVMRRTLYDVFRDIEGQLGGDEDAKSG